MSVPSPALKLPAPTAAPPTTASVSPAPVDTTSTAMFSARPALAPTARTVSTTSHQCALNAPLDTILPPTTLVTSVLLSAPPVKATAPASLSPTTPAKLLSPSIAPQWSEYVTLAVRAAPQPVPQPVLSVWTPTILPLTLSLVAASCIASLAAAPAAPVRSTSLLFAYPAGLTPS